MASETSKDEREGKFQEEQVGGGGHVGRHGDGVEARVSLGTVGELEVVRGEYVLTLPAVLVHGVMGDAGTPAWRGPGSPGVC